MELKTMRKITDFNEFLGIWTINHEYRYYGNKPITKEHEKELEEKEYKKDFKRYNIYVLKDNNYIIYDTKPRISKEFYFDDETDYPTMREHKDLFIRENISDNLKNIVTSWKNDNNCYARKLEKPYFTQNYYTDKQEFKQINIKCYGNLSYNNFNNEIEKYVEKYDLQNNYFIRFLDNEEIEDFIKIEKEIEKDYRERLEKYFVRYNKNINSIGYWVNR